MSIKLKKYIISVRFKQKCSQLNCHSSSIIISKNTFHAKFEAAIQETAQLNAEYYDQREEESEQTSTRFQERLKKQIEKIGALKVRLA